MRKILFGRIIPLAIGIFIFSTLLTSQVQIRITPGYQKQESFQVKAVLVDWTYTDRRGEIPVKIYYPVTRFMQRTSLPVIIFSHDQNRTLDEFDYLGQHWASRGYVSVFLPQYNNGRVAWKGSFKQERDRGYDQRSVKEHRRDMLRDNDISFAIDRLAIMNTNDRTFRGMFNLNYIGIVGDYFDANAAMRVAHQWADTSRSPRRALNYPCVRAIILLSEPMQNRKTFFDSGYSQISIPILNMAETTVDIPSSRHDRRLSQRMRPYEFSVDNDIYSIIFNVADYMIFSGDRHQNFGKDKMDIYHMSFIKDVTTAFWDAYLKNDRQVKQWLRKGGFENYYNGYDMYYRH